MRACDKTEGCKGPYKHSGPCSPVVLNLHPSELKLLGKMDAPSHWSEEKQAQHNRELYGTNDPKLLDKLYSDRFNDQDVVNHPSHHTAYKGIEVIQLTEQMNFNRGNAVKYIARAGLKDQSKEIEDLEKAKWYLQREIDRLKDANG